MQKHPKVYADTAIPCVVYQLTHPAAKQVFVDTLGWVCDGQGSECFTGFTFWLGIKADPRANHA